MNMDFSSPLTTELFDRTPAQRAARTAEVVRLRKAGVQEATVEAMANRAMFGYFLESIDQEAGQRARQMIGAELNTDGPALDASVVRLMAVTKVVADLAVMHDAMPLPGLERIAAHTNG